MASAHHSVAALAVDEFDGLRRLIEQELRALEQGGTSAVGRKGLGQIKFTSLQLGSDLLHAGEHVFEAHGLDVGMRRRCCGAGWA